MTNTVVLDNLHSEINEARIELLKSIMENDIEKHADTRRQIKELEVMIKIAK